MKYRKEIEKLLKHKSSNQGQVIVALLAGLAAGAVISVLFAPNSGAGTREKLASGAKHLGCDFQEKYKSLREKIFGTDSAEEEATEHEVPHFKHKPVKKRKSDLKDIVEQAHQTPQNQDQQEEEAQ